MNTTPAVTVSINTPKRPIRLLICDDSIFMRMAIRTLCEEEQQIIIVGEAKDGAEAIEAARTLEPDVVTMDVDMPGVDGVSATETIVRDYDIPVIILSGVTQRRSALANRALEIGAVDVIWKSASLMDIDIGGVAHTIIEKVLLWGRRPVNPGPYRDADAPIIAGPHDAILLSLGDGGPHALRMVLEPLPESGPPVIITADIPMACMEGFIQFVQRATGRPTVEAAERQVLRSGEIFIAHNTARLAVGSADSELVFQRVSPHETGNIQSTCSMMQATLANVAKNPLIVILSGASAEAWALKSAEARGLPVVVQLLASCVETKGARMALTEVSSAHEMSPSAISGLVVAK